MSRTLAIVLAAGDGKRLGGPKALLAWPSPSGKDRPLAIAHAEERLAAECAEVLIVVRKAMIPALLGYSRPGISLLSSDAAGDLGPAGSLAFAVSRLPEGDLIVVTPVDTQPAKAETVRALKERLLADPTLLAARPVYHGRGGHPVVLRRAALDAYKAGPPPTLRDHLGSLGDRVAVVEVADPTVVLDLNTPSDVMGVLRVLPRFLPGG
ncbi:MAG: NTP transferase domain-containing protein [Byssovorax sp.]